MKDILVAIDFSEVTATVLAVAADLAFVSEAPLWLVHVAAPDPDFVGYDAGPQVVRDQVALELRDEHREIQRHADALRARGLQVTALLVQGPTAERILDEAERLGADLVIVGSHGHGALHRALVGSTSERVLRRSRRPVLVVPAPRGEDDTDGAT